MVYCMSSFFAASMNSVPRVVSVESVSSYSPPPSAQSLQLGKAKVNGKEGHTLVYLVKLLSLVISVLRMNSWFMISFLCTPIYTLCTASHEVWFLNMLFSTMNGAIFCRFLLSCSS